MKNIKVIYHIGEKIGAETIVKKGKINLGECPLRIKSNEQTIVFDDLRHVEIYRLNGLGTMVKIINGDRTIFVAAYRLFFNIGTGFVITNLLGTLKIKKLLECKK